jgi:peptidoglycan/LPS O-acetylase OafA/YrhL
MQGGFIGVDVFFVISGFLISTIIFENLDRGSFSILEFYARRIKRIFPALLTVLFASLAFGWFALLADEYEQLGKHALAGVGFVSNFVLWNEAGYFDNSAETKPLLHLWSLGIEEQFYLIWPFLCLLFWKFKPYRLAILMTLIVVSLGLNIKTVGVDGVAAFYSPLTRFWELLCGAALAYFSVYKAGALSAIHRHAVVSNSSSVLGILLLVYGFFAIDKNASFPGYWAIIPVMGAVLIILAGPAALFNRWMLSNKVAVFFGLISFPLYLWHWPLLVFLRIVERGQPDSVSRLVAVLLSVVLAWMTYHFVERAVRSSGGFKHVKTLLVLSVLVAGAGFTIHAKNGFPTRDAVTSSEFTEKVQYQFMGPLWAYTKNDTCLSEYPYPDQDKLAWWFCMKSSESPATIILLGSSLANQLYPGFAKNERLAHHTVLSIGTCDIASTGAVDDPRNPCSGSRAQDQAQFIDEVIKRTPSLKYVVVDGLSSNPSPDYIARVSERISFFESQGLTVIVFTPNLRLGFHPKACFKSPLKPNPRDCTVPSSTRDEVLLGFTPLIDALKQSNPKVLVFEQNGVFCDQGKQSCSFVRDGLPLLRDEVHTSEYASVLLQQYFNDWAQNTTPLIFDAKSSLTNQ